MAIETLDILTSNLATLQDSHILIETKLEDPRLVYVNPRGSILLGTPSEMTTEKSFKDLFGITQDELGAIMIALTNAALLHTQGCFEESDQASPIMILPKTSHSKTIKTRTRRVSIYNSADLFDLSLSDITSETKLMSRMGAIEAINKVQGFDGLKSNLGIIIEKVVPFNSALIHLIDDDGNIIEFARWGDKPIYATPFTHKDDSDLISEMVETRQGTRIDDTHKDNRWRKTGRDQIRSFIAAPIIIRDRNGNEKLIGLLELNNNAQGAYNEDDLVSLISLAEYVAYTFEKNDAVMRDPLCPEIYIYKGVKYYGEREFARSLRFRPPHPISAMFIDLDYFKQLNNAYGHLKANDLLIEVVRRLRAATRDYDIIGRFGDEFMVILPEADLYATEQAAKRFAQLLKVPIKIDGHQITLTASIGINQYNVQNEDIATGFKTLMDQANHAMYISKDDGKDSITVWDQSVEKRWQARPLDNILSIT